MKNNKEKDWFDSPRMVTYVIIGLLIVLIILSQSFAINSQLGTSDIIRSILNHNSIYVLTLIYFVMLHFKVGKKYFDHLNVIMLVFFGLITLASMFTVFQSFGLASLLQLGINILFTIYFLYAFISNTVIGKELHLSTSVIVELKNEQYFYLITTLLVVHLVVALINSTSFESIVISLLEVLFYFLFARYISLYKEYDDMKVSSSKKKKIKKEEESDK
jgi:membrane protein